MVTDQHSPNKYSADTPLPPRVQVTVNRKIHERLRAVAVERGMFIGKLADKVLSTWLAANESKVKNEAA